MGQSLYKNYVHIVFSTKFREPTITDSISPQLFRYLAGICKNLECYPVQVGGYQDHVHILCLLSKSIPLMKLVEEIKSHSSKWMKTNGPAFANFYWQGGYAAFSVYPKDVDVVKRYIETQKEHHEKKKFEDELRCILNEQKIEFDERYIWD